MPDVHLGKGVTVRTAPCHSPLFSFAMQHSQGMKLTLSEHVWPSLSCHCCDLLLLQIGTVFASENYICPNAVGVDIGDPFDPLGSAACLLTDTVHHDSTAWGTAHHIYQSHNGVSTRLAQGCCCVVNNVYHHLRIHVGMYDAGCGMCAVPVDGLHKEDMTHEQLLKIQSLLKRRIPTGISPEPYHVRCKQLRVQVASRHLLI